MKFFCPLLLSPHPFLPKKEGSQKERGTIFFPLPLLPLLFSYLLFLFLFLFLFPFSSPFYKWSTKEEGGSQKERGKKLSNCTNNSFLSSSTFFSISPPFVKLTPGRRVRGGGTRIEKKKKKKGKGKGKGEENGEKKKEGRR